MSCRKGGAAFSTTHNPSTRSASIPLASLSSAVLDCGRHSPPECLLGTGRELAFSLSTTAVPHEEFRILNVAQASKPVSIGDLPAPAKARRGFRSTPNGEESLSGVNKVKPHRLQGQARVLGLLPVTQHIAAVKRSAGCWVHLVAGALAGGASRTATAPLEVLRLQAITGTRRQRNPLKAAQQIVADHGWNGLYRGNMLNVVRAVPQKALDFFSFEIYKGWLGADKHEGMGLTFVAAGMAGATSTVLLHPLEVIRSRLTVSMSMPGQRQSLVVATSQMVAHEGLGSLYKGLLPSVMAIIPEAAITYGMFDALKRSYARWTGQAEAGLVPSIACGVLSSFTGQMVAFPMESVARRLQVQQAAALKLGTIPFVQEIMRKEGPLTLYRGSGTAAMKVIPMAAISFSTYEVARLWLAQVGGCTDKDSLSNMAEPGDWLEADS